MAKVAEQVTHTPGPWKRFKHHESNGYIEVVQESGAEVCTLYGGDARPTIESDAHLIAAAPDLLAACVSALGWYGLDGDGISDPTLSKLRAAIAKAEGR